MSVLQFAIKQAVIFLAQWLGGLQYMGQIHLCETCITVYAVITSQCTQASQQCYLCPSCVLTLKLIACRLEELQLRTRCCSTKYPTLSQNALLPHSSSQTFMRSWLGSTAPICVCTAVRPSCGISLLRYSCCCQVYHDGSLAAHVVSESVLLDP